MRVAVFGPSGMLGKHVMRAAEQAGHIAIPIHRRMFDILSFNSIRRTLEENEIDSVINCIGVIPVRSTSVYEMLDVNARFPWLLCDAADTKPCVLVSTDCVFSGRNRFRYDISDIPDPRDIYGKTKAIGEVSSANAMVVRTSFIGCDHGLMHMVLSAGRSARAAGQTINIQGWNNALWTGSTVQAVARSLVECASNDFKPGLCHLSTKVTRTKYEVVSRLVEINEFDVVVEKVHYPIFCRALKPTIELQDVFEALDEYKCVQRAA